MQAEVQSLQNSLFALNQSNHEYERPFLKSHWEHIGMFPIPQTHF